MVILPSLKETPKRVEFKIFEDFNSKSPLMPTTALTQESI